MSSTSEIKYNKEQTSHGIEQLKQSQKELYEADVLFYKGVMALAAAKGMDLIISEDSGINLYMPEKIVIECREEIAHLIEDITAKINLIEGFNQEPKESTRSVERREIVEEEIKTGAQPLYGPPNTGKIDKPIQALYAPPGLEPIKEAEPIVQPLYGPPNTDRIDKPIQALYAPPGIEPIKEVEPIVQPLYGPPNPDRIDQPIQALYAPPVLEPIKEVEPIVQPLYGPPIDVVREYEPIPDTNSTITAGIVEKNYVSKHPKLIGGLAAAAGLFGIPTIISDDLDEEEEKRYNQKKTNY